MGQLNAFMKKSMRVKLRNKGQFLCEIIAPIILLALAVLIAAVVKPLKFEEVGDTMGGMIPLLTFCQAQQMKTGAHQPIYVATKAGVLVDSALLADVVARLSNASMACGISAVPVSKTVEALFDEKQDGWTAGVEVTALSQTVFNYTIRMPNQDGRIPTYMQVPDTSSSVNDGVDDSYKRTIESITRSSSEYTMCTNSSLCRIYPYAMSGFTGLQMLLDSSYRGAVGSTLAPQFDAFFKNMWITYFPHPQVERKIDFSIVAQYLGFSYIACTFVLAKQMLSEKEKKIKEGMLIMSMKTSTFWLGWFLTSLVSVMPISLLVLLAGLGVIFRDSSAGLVIIVVFLFAFSLIALTFLVYTVFKKPRTGGMFVLILQIIGIIAYSTIQQQNLSPHLLRFLSLLSPLAFLRAATLMAGGVKDATASDYSIGQAIALLIFDTLAYLFFAWYLDKVIPGEYGQNLPWYFIFSPSYWCGDHRDERLGRVNSGSVQMVATDGIQPLPVDVDVAVQVVNLRKVFRVNPLRVSEKDKVAVSGLSFAMVRGQIFSLLGHNGAGKTTTISMMTGMIPITSGDITIGGRSVRTEMQSIRRSMGFCPQHDVLYDELSVEEHLQLYGEIKGLTGPALQAEIDRLIPAVDLQLKRHNRVSELSGGMKRKLSVAIAYIANPEIVILDEPTAGLDPLSRRLIWELINANKSTRTTLLTTHFLDEADILGDRIGIMANGVMKCLGTSLFLKHRFGLGYTLGIVKDAEHSDAAALRQFVHFHIPTAEEQTCSRGEQSFRLPMSEKGRFPPLLSGLRSVAGVLSFGLSITTLEEVFLRIADESDEFAHHAKPGEGLPLRASTPDRQQATGGAPVLGVPMYAGTAISAEHLPKGAPTPPVDLEAGGIAHHHQQQQEDLEAIARDAQGSRFWAQCHAILLKRLWQTKRSLITFCMNLGFCIILLIVGGALSTVFANTLAQVPIDLTPANIWQAPISNVFYSVDPTITAMTGIGNRTSIPLGTSFDTTPASQRLTQLMPGPPVFTGVSQTLYNMWVNGPDAILNNPGVLAMGVAPVSTLSSLAAAFVGVDGGDAASAAAVASQTSFGGLPPNATVPFMTIIDNQRITHSLPVLINQLPFWAGATGNLTISPSTNPLVWKAGVGDVRVAVFVQFFVFAFCFPPGYIGVPIVAERVNKTRHLLRLMGMRSFPYWLVTAGFDFLYMLIPSIVTIISIFAFEVTPLNAGGIGAVIIILILYQLASIPFTYCLSRPMSAPENFQLASISLSILVGLLGTIAYLILDLIGNLQDSDSLILASKIIFYILNLIPIFNVSVAMYRIGSPPSSGVKWDSPSFADVMDPATRVTQCIWYQLANIVLYSMILAISETNWFSRMMASRGITNTQPTEPIDSDVQDEKRRLLSAGATGATGDTIAMHGLRKVYPARGLVPEKVAVNSMYLGIPKGEVFGLLGANGAGKTTTMKMLTGDIGISAGEACVDGHNIKQNIGGAYKVMGYCPQFDALWNDLTGREHLRIFSMIKGIPRQVAKQLADSMLVRMSLQPYADKLAGTYSGGNKRKLCVTVALMASPKVVYLDEPSTGMDPASRRFMWAEISSTMNSRAVILTTHSMEEADALCNRIGIVVNGDLVCLGSSQHLKNKFGSGLQIQIHTTVETQDHVIGFVNHMFPHAIVVQCFAGNIAMEADAPGVDLGAVFTQFESAKEQLRILDYSISQTTLEQVFLRFARGQVSEEMHR